MGTFILHKIVPVCNSTNRQISLFENNACTALIITKILEQNLYEFNISKLKKVSKSFLKNREHFILLVRFFNLQVLW